MDKSRENKFTVREGSKRLCCIKHSARIESDTMVVFLHGFAADKNESNLFFELSSLLGKKGFNSLRFDFSGCGESNGNYKKINITDYQKDFHLVLQHLKNKHPEQSKKIIVIAFSLGAAIAIKSYKKKQGITNMILISPALFPKKDMLPRYRMPEIIEEFKINGYINKKGTKIGQKLINSFNKIEIENKIPKIDCPVLIIHGTEDKRISFNSSESARDRFKKASFVPIKGADHAYKNSNNLRNVVYGSIIQWLESNSKLQLNIFNSNSCLSK